MARANTGIGALPALTFPSGKAARASTKVTSSRAFLPRRGDLPAPRWRLSALLLPLLALLPIPLWIACGYGGQDFSFHVPSWLELHRAWAAGEWRLGWAAGAQYGYGEPRFCFYPPLSLILGAALSFLLPARILPGAVAWLALTAAGAAMWAAWGRLVGERNRLLAATAYMLNWYLITCVVIRYAIAEVWVLALLPLLFLFFYSSVEEGRPAAVPGLAFLLGIAWLTNIPASIVLFYSLGAAAALVAWRRKRPGALLAFALAEAGALLLASCRIAPALQESSWIQAGALLQTLSFRNSLLFRRIPPPHAFPYFLDGSALLLSPFLLLLAWRLRGGRAALRLPPLVMFLGAMLFFEQPLSIPVWSALPRLAYVAFAFRFLGLFSLAAVFLVAAPQARSWPRASAGALLLALSLYPFFFFFHNLFAFERFPRMAQAERRWRQGYEGMHEYAPKQAPARALSFDVARPPEPPGLFASNACRPVLLSRSSNAIEVAVSSPAPCTLTLNVFAFPYWSLESTGEGAPPQLAAEAGRLSARIPGGPHRLRFSFQPASALRTWTAGLSGASALALLGLALAGGRIRSRGRQGADPARPLFPVPFPDIRGEAGTYPLPALFPSLESQDDAVYASGLDAARKIHPAALGGKHPVSRPPGHPR